MVDWASIFHTSPRDPELFVVAALDAPRTLRCVSPSEAYARSFYDMLARRGETPIAAINGRRLRWEDT
jgi:hypothetical protein